MDTIERLSTITTTRQLIVETCPTCHITHGIPKELYDLAQERTSATSDPLKVYCPNGHWWWYTGETEAVRLRRQLDAQRNDAQHQREQRQATERQLQATKGVVTRMKRRAKAGVCPCCGRTFAALAQHMATKHPDYAKD
jgi:hypothetical protein